MLQAAMCTALTGLLMRLASPLTGHNFIGRLFPRRGNIHLGGVFKLTSLAVYLLSSPVEIHLAGGERVSVWLGGGGRSGGMLMAHRQSRTLLWTRAAAAGVAAVWGSLFLDGTVDVML